MARAPTQTNRHLTNGDSIASASEGEGGKEVVQCDSENGLDFESRRGERVPPHLCLNGSFTYRVLWALFFFFNLTYSQVLGKPRGCGGRRFGEESGIIRALVIIHRGFFFFFWSFYPV